MFMRHDLPLDPLPGQIPNAANTDAWAVDDWQRLDRFLVLGTDGGTYYTGERALARESAEVVRRCIAADGARTVSRIVAISLSGRAPKNDPAIFALAMAAKLADEPARRAAYAALPQVCRIGTHLMHFAAYAQAFGGWGRGMRKAVGAWFNARPADELALQLAKYQSRDGWSHRDLLRLAHPRAASPSHDRLFAWSVKGVLPDGAERDNALALIVAMEELKHTPDVTSAARIIRERRVPRECVPTQLLQAPEIWEALLEAMPMTAMIRNLATMTRVGLLEPGSAASHEVIAQLGDADRLRRARVHPIAVLAALVTYTSGRGVRPLGPISDALDAAFYASFGIVEPAGKRIVLALDVSSSMARDAVAGLPDVTPRLASAAMALVTAATEAHHTFIAFTSGAGGITPLAISPRQRLADAVTEVSRHPMGGTDCALPMLWAQKHRIDVDTFCVYTDNETWAGNVHPAQALRAYRDARGIPAKLVVVGMTSNGFSIADPNDAGMLDVVGFDASAPPVIADFARA